jgi:hypothetical protein
LSKNALTFASGLGLIALGVVDAAINPFAFATAPQFWIAGSALVATSLGLKSDGKRDEE